MMSNSKGEKAYQEMGVSLGS